MSPAAQRRLGHAPLPELESELAACARMRDCQHLVAELVVGDLQVWRGRLIAAAEQAGRGGGDFQERCRRLAPIQAACSKSNSSRADVGSGGSLIQTTDGWRQQRTDLDHRLGWR